MAEGSSPKDRLLKAARTVLDRDGLEGLTLRAIAREAGVSHGAPLRHFDSLASLLTALSTRGFRDLSVEFTRSIEAAGAEASAGDRLAQTGAGYIRFATGNPGVFGLMFRPELLDLSDVDYQSAGAEAFGLLTQLVQAAQDEGWRPEQPTDQLAALLWSHVHGIAQLWLHGALQAVIAVEDVDQLIEVFMRLGLD